MKDQSQNIQDLVHQFSTRLQESNNANRIVLEHNELIQSLTNQYVSHINELADPMTSKERMIYLEEQINTVNSQIIYHSQQEREWRIIRDQKSEEIRQIKRSSPQAEQIIEERSPKRTSKNIFH